MRVGFLQKRDKPEARTLAADLAALVRDRGGEVMDAIEEPDGIPGARHLPARELGANIDVLVVLGGDGTFLHGAALVGDAGVPVLGINLGHLGFMTQYALAEARSALDDALAGRLTVTERMRLRVSTSINGGPSEHFGHALNEAVVNQLGKTRLLDLAADLDGTPLTTYKADGLIVSTPTGSTAYNLAAGGPILSPDLEAMVLTPICPHTLTNRPVVLRADANVRVTNVSPDPVSLTVDGQWNRELRPGASVEIRKADHPLRLFRSPRAFFGVLREKLSWGER